MLLSQQISTWELFCSIYTEHNFVEIDFETSTGFSDKQRAIMTETLGPRLVLFNIVFNHYQHNV